MTGTQLATISTSEWAMTKEQAGLLVKTGFLPQAVSTPEKAIAIMLKARELGIPPMYGLSNIAVIQGKPACNAELLLALIYRDHGDDAIQFVEASNTRATISYKRRGWKERQTFSFTSEDARLARLTGDNWTKYPGAMLRARCISAVARMAYPDSIGGMYTAEELGAQEDAETGEIAASVPPLPARTALPVQFEDRAEDMAHYDATPIDELPDAVDEAADAETLTAASIDHGPPKPGRDGTPREWFAYLTHKARKAGLAHIPSITDDDSDEHVTDLNRSLKASLTGPK